MSAHSENTTPTAAQPPLQVGWQHIALILLCGGVAALLSRYIDHAVPVMLAALVGAAVPHRFGRRTRIAMAIICGLVALFVARMWVGDEIPIPEAPPYEPPTLLSWILGLPLAGAVAILFLPRQAPRLLRAVTVLVMLGTLAVSLFVLRVPMGREFHFNQDFVWLPRLGIHYHVALDGISLWLVLLTTFTMPIATYVSFGSISARMKDWCFSLLLLEGALLGSFVALDLFLFYIFFELCLIPMYVMIGVWGGQARIKAALKFFIYTMVGSVLMLAALLYMAHTYSKLTGHPSFDYFDLQRVLLPISKGQNDVLPHGPQFWVWAAFTLAFIIKVPMWPVHTWLPDAHTEAPTAGSIVLAAIMLKLGTYGYLRFSMGLFPEASSYFAANLAGVAVLGGILYGALCAWKQDDFKRLVAYSSVAHLGYVMLGLFACTSASMEGAVLQMVNHGISTGALFLLVGVIYDRRHTRMTAEFGGLAKVMPLYAAMFVVATLASVGLPGTNGFIGEFTILLGAFLHKKIYAVIASLGIILGAGYMLWLYQRIAFGKITNPHNEHLTDMNLREVVAALPLVILVFVIGLYPNAAFNVMHASAANLIQQVNAKMQTAPAIAQTISTILPH
jgi:NADH-quinone oxidoreductase subunit M